MDPKYAQASTDLNLDGIAVLSHGVQRSGSTWVWQILCDLYPPGAVLKTHNYLVLPDSIRVVSTYRDARDCAVSHWRQANPGRECMTLEEMFLYAGIYQHTFWVLSQYAERRSAALIRYEDAIVDPGIIFRTVHHHLGVEVSPERQSEVLAAHSLETNKRHQDAGTGAEINLIQNHIHEGEVGTWKRFVSDHGLLTELLEPQLKRWGYE